MHYGRPIQPQSILIRTIDPHSHSHCRGIEHQRPSGLTRARRDRQYSTVGCVGVLMSVVFSVLAGFYRYFVRRAIAVYRSIMRRLAKHAVRSSLKQAMTPMDCAGIMDREGTVYLKIRIAEGVYAENGSQLRVVEATNDEPWGVIEVVQVTKGDYAICKPIDR